jgi:hypothetical protein
MVSHVSSRIVQALQQYHLCMADLCCAGKKCLVLDIDYTLFDLNSSAEHPDELARPYLHEFLTACYEYYDIIIWSATNMKWVEVSLGYSSSCASSRCCSEQLPAMTKPRCKMARRPQCASFECRRTPHSALPPLFALCLKADQRIAQCMLLCDLQVKMRELGVLGNDNYKLVCMLDHKAMLTVQTEKYGVFDCKPLQFIWAKVCFNHGLVMALPDFVELPIIRLCIQSCAPLSVVAHCCEAGRV